MFRKCWEFLDYLGDYQLLKKDILLASNGMMSIRNLMKIRQMFQMLLQGERVQTQDLRIKYDNAYL